MTDKQIQHFFKNVMVCLNHHDWSLNIKEGHDSYCWIKNKKIDVGKDYGGDVRQILLHEIAHINTARFCNQKHNYQFWSHLEYLVKNFLKSDLDEHQKLHRQYASKGFFSKVYEK